MNEESLQAAYDAACEEVIQLEAVTSELRSMHDEDMERIAELERERDEAIEAYRTVSAGKPIGPVACAHTVMRQAAHIAELSAERDVFARTLNKRDERITELERERDEARELAIRWRNEALRDASLVADPELLPWEVSDE